MSGPVSNWTYSFKSIAHPNLYMTAANDSTRTEFMGRVESDANAWYLKWNNGGDGINKGGNWTIRNAENCNFVTVPVGPEMPVGDDSSNASIWDIWPVNTSDTRNAIMISVPNTYFSLGLKSGSPESPVMFLRNSNVSSSINSAQLWSYSAINSFAECETGQGSLSATSTYSSSVSLPSATQTQLPSNSATQTLPSAVPTQTLSSTTQTQASGNRRILAKGL